MPNPLFVVLCSTRKRISLSPPAKQSPQCWGWTVSEIHDVVMRWRLVPATGAVSDDCSHSHICGQIYRSMRSTPTQPIT